MQITKIIAINLICSGVFITSYVFAAQPSKDKQNTQLITPVVSVKNISAQTEKALTPVILPEISTKKPTKNPTKKPTKLHVVKPNIQPNIPKPVMKTPAVVKVAPNIKPSSAQKPKPVTLPVARIDQHKPTTKILPAALKVDQLNAIKEANEMRGASVAKELGEALGAIPGAPVGTDGISPDLGLGAGNHNTGLGGHDVDLTKLPGHGKDGFDVPEGMEYLPDLPSNEDEGLSSSAFRPGANLASIMAGAAGLDSHKEQTPDGGWVTFEVTNNDDGSTSTRQETYSPEGELERTAVMEIDENGIVTRHRISHPDSPNPARVDRRGSYPGPHDPSQSQDPNSDNVSPELAAWAAQFDHSKKGGGPLINRVNPGPDGATPNNKAPQLVLPEDMLVINPDVENASGANRQFSEAEKSAMAEQLRQTVKGPGGHPGSPEIETTR